MSNGGHRVALVHDWIVTMRGGEKVLEVLCELFPDATLFTLLHRKGTASPPIERMAIRTSFIQHLPFSASNYQRYLPLFPAAIRSFDLTGYDLVVSSSHAVAKGIRAPSAESHLCYCYTPMRYIWDQYEDYFGRGRSSLPTRAAMKLAVGPLRRWDIRTAQGVGAFVAISKNVQERILRIYGRGSEVVYPPVDVGRFSVSEEDDGYFLIVSALVPYKRIDIAVKAFNRIGKKLIVVGTGPEFKSLRRLANSNITFEGWVADDSLPEYYRRCRGLIFPGEEDFGIVPVEAMACGKPVVAYARGGALETVGDGKTGVLFDKPSAESLLRAVEKLEGMHFDSAAIRRHAEQFDRARFKGRMNRFIESFVRENGLRKASGGTSQP